MFSDDIEVPGRKKPVPVFGCITTDVATDRRGLGLAAGRIKYIPDVDEREPTKAAYWKGSGLAAGRTDHSPEYGKSETILWGRTGRAADWRAPGVTADWREAKPVGECLKHLYLSSNLSDASINFSQDGNAEPTEILHVHKFVLCLRSDVFESMFQEVMSDRNTDVFIGDIDAQTMNEVLRFIYYDEAHLNGDNVMCCFYAAKKYRLHGLVNKCETFLTNSICPQNVCTIFEQARFYEATELAIKCLKFILENAQIVFKHDDYWTLSEMSMHIIIKHQNLSLDEEQIFNAAKRWAENKCKLSKECVSGANIRKNLSIILYAIRFPLLSNETFARVVSPTGILTHEEEILIFRYIATKKTTSRNNITIGKFSCVQRTIIIHVPQDRKQNIKMSKKNDTTIYPQLARTMIQNNF